jgi:hypothetical protein
MAEQKAAPGLVYRPTKAGRTPLWRASKAAVKAGYPVKSVHLEIYANDERLLRQRCERLQAEMLE